MADLWSGRWRGLEFRVELRSLGTDGGHTLRVGPADLDSPRAEWLRFDCFDENPHWHLDPGGEDEIRSLTDDGDTVREVFDMLDRDLAGLLERAGAPAALVSDVARSDEESDMRGFLREAECYMRHRPAVLEDLDPRQLERRVSAKWQFYPRDVIPSWVAEMDFPLAAPVQAELQRLIDVSDMGYPLDDVDTGLPAAFSERMTERFAWTPDPGRVELLSEVVQGIYIAVEAYSGVGEGVIVQTPIYPPFHNTIADTKRRLVDNPLRAAGSRLEFDLDGLATVIDAETRLLMLCNPHNPSGRVMLREDLERIAALVLEHDLIVISDEIHADLLFDGRTHIPFATLGSEIAARTVTFTSTSKAFNIPGLRLAIAHFGSDALQARFNECHPVRVRGGIGLPGIYASIAAWRWGQPWLDEVVAHLQGNRDYAERAFAERIPEIRFYPPESTYLAWLDCSALDISGSPMHHFMKHGRVALSNGRRFGEAWSRHVRLNFATSRAILTETIDRMAKAMDR
jgi:cystathionine beta-lyase